ncbi:MAG: ATP:cob(I)alamin adenosyltransferase [Acidiferrobacteraceae bacterium]|nr:ATP:cob(I)alamin adenosyltransferase [Acidiferrobacteraceae bacterium]|tara:strand:- start:9488 stop:10045 length:558 start_codon:yes stop_codon:yes gene_type:complete
MGNRLSKIYTRTGDDGTTGLADGTRVLKTSARIGAMGDVDELNSIIGLLITEPSTQHNLVILSDVQNSLFDIGGELALPNQNLVSEEKVSQVEELLDSMNSALPPLKEFILPGGSRAAAICHQARSVCRRAERRLLALSAEEVISEITLRYINRLSDLLFVMARTLNKDAKHPDVFWNKPFNDND